MGFVEPRFSYRENQNELLWQRRVDHTESAASSFAGTDDYGVPGILSPGRVSWDPYLFSRMRPGGATRVFAPFRSVPTAVMLG